MAWNWTNLNKFMSKDGIEGPSWSVLHYPENKAGKSGPTIARGFDVGQHSIDDLNRIFDEKEDSVLLSKLKPLAGKKGQEAWDLVHSPNKVKFTSDEILTILKKTMESKINPIIKDFNKDQTIGKFEALPDGL